MIQKPPKNPKLRPFVLSLCAVLLSACSLINGLASGPALGVQSFLGLFKTAKPVDLVALQDSLLRFADDFINMESRSVDLLEVNGSKITRFDQVRFKLHFASDMVTLSTGSNPIGNLINVVVYVSTLRSSLEEYWIPLDNGISEAPILRALQGSEKDIWDIANQWLSEQQVKQLKTSIDNWKLNQPPEIRDFGSFGSISLVNDLVSDALIKNEGESGLFAVFNLDPLASLDPATRELTQTRLFGERTLFLGKHMPQLVEWQAELLSLRTLKNPTLTGLVDDANRFAQTADDMSKTLSGIPGTIATERKAIFDQLREETPEIKALSAELTRTFEEGQRMAASVSEVLSSIKEIRAEAIRDGTQDNAALSGKDLINVLAHLEGTLNQTNQLLQIVKNDEYIEKLKQVNRSMNDSAIGIVDYAFKKLIILAAFCFGMMGLMHFIREKFRHG